MASFDIVSRPDAQRVDNAVNVAKKEIQNRYDFQGSGTELTYDRKENLIRLVTDNEMRVQTVEDILLKRMVAQQVDPKTLDFSAEPQVSGKQLIKRIAIREGIDRDTARHIVKLIKDQGLKVQPAIQDDQVRVTGKKLDDLQAVIALLKQSELEVPLQYLNMKS